jgi:hypothetical protein
LPWQLVAEADPPYHPQDIEKIAAILGLPPSQAGDVYDGFVGLAACNNIVSMHDVKKGKVATVEGVPVGVSDRCYVGGLVLPQSREVTVVCPIKPGAVTPV